MRKKKFDVVMKCSRCESFEIHQFEEKPKCPCCDLDLCEPQPYPCRTKECGAKKEFLVMGWGLVNPSTIRKESI